MRYLSFLLTVLFLSFVTLSYAQEIKMPVVAGLFYPASSDELIKTINGFLSQSNVEIENEPVVLICPHAGYEYSGQVAGFGYKAIEGETYQTVIIIGPSHYLHFEGASIYNKGVFQTPLGDIEVDSDLADSLIQENKKLYFYPQAYTREHSIEVQLPFLQRTLKDFRIVPILMGEDSFEDCKRLGETLIKVIREKKRNVLVIASSDLVHYRSYNEANLVDGTTLSYLKRLNPQLLFEKIKNNEAELCGAGPVIATLVYAEGIGATKVKVLKYANSGDISGDKQKVVGYASIAIYREDEDMLDNEDMLNEVQKKRLLGIARQSIDGYLKTRKEIKFSEDDPVLLKKKGVFVTLKENGQLRGCIGHIVADTSLYQNVAQMAIQAAVGDPRFLPLKPEDLVNLDIEISVLSPLEKIDNVHKIEVGKHGILIMKNSHSGLLLPQVAREYNWNRNQFLEHTCLKAGLPIDAWKSGTEIYIFSAEVFGER